MATVAEFRSYQQALAEKARAEACWGGGWRVESATVSGGPRTFTIWRPRRAR